MPQYFYCHEGIMEKKILVLFLCAIICFSGCDKKEKSETKKISGNITIGQLDSKDVYEKKAIQWDMTNMVSYGDEAVVELEDGYIKYRDPKTADSIYACSKNNCKHNDSQCQAYFEESCQSAFVYEGYLYVLVKTDNNRMEVYKANTDGSSREIICGINLEKINGSSYVEYSYMANHQIYVDVVETYYLDKNENYKNDEEYLYNAERKKNIVYGFDCKSGNASVLIEFPEAYDDVIARMYYDAGYLFIERYYREKSLLALSDYLDEKYDSYQAMESAFLSKYSEREYFQALGYNDKTYVYSLKNGDISELKLNSELLQDASISYGNNKFVLFVGTVNSQNGKYCYDIESNQIKEINLSVGDVRYIDGKIIYTISDSQNSFKYNEINGKSEKLSNLNRNVVTEYIGENSKYIFYLDEEENLCSINKNDFWRGVDNTILLKKAEIESE